MTRVIRITKSQIVEWGMENIDECGWPVDATEMDTHCWRCGHERVTQRCHVIPDSLKGKDIPSNYRLFCYDCHLEQPNVNDPNATDEWVRSTNIGYYNLFWKLREVWWKLSDEISFHWGEDVNRSTQEWKIKEFIKRTNLDNLIVPDMERVKRCIETMEYIPEEWGGEV